MKRFVYGVLLVLLITITAGCQSEKAIKIGTEWKNNKIRNIVQQIPADTEVYVQYVQPDAFNAESVELEVYDGEALVSGGSSRVKPGEKKVIIPVTIAKPGSYRLVILIQDVEVFHTPVAVN